MAGLTIDNPVTFSQVLASTHVIPGDTISLLPGTYTGDFIVAFMALAEQPIKIKAHIPGTVVIDGSITIQSTFSLTSKGIILEGLEFTRTDWTTRRPATWRDVPPNLYITAPEIKIRNCIIHDGSECILAFGGGLVELYGCLIYNGGENPADAGASGHSLYTHNNAGTYMLIENNIFLASFDYGFHAHSSGSNYIKNYHVKNNIFGKCNAKHTFGNDGGLLDAVQDVVFENNENIDTWWWFNRWSTQGRNIVVTDNYFDGPSSNSWGDAALQFKSMTDVTFTGNTVAHNGGIGLLKLPADVAYIWDNNTYYSAGGNDFFVAYPGTNGIYEPFTFAAWKSQFGYDANAIRLDYPPSNRVRLIPNIYDAARAHLAIYNYELLDSVDVDVSSIYSNGDVIQVHQAQDYFGDIQNPTVADGKISIGMRAEVHTMVKPIGHDANIDPLMCPKYGAFVLEKA